MKSSGTIVYTTKLQAKCVKIGWHMGPPSPLPPHRPCQRPCQCPCHHPCHHPPHRHRHQPYHRPCHQPHHHLTTNPATNLATNLATALPPTTSPTHHQPCHQPRHQPCNRSCHRPCHWPCHRPCHCGWLGRQGRGGGAPGGGRCNCGGVGIILQGSSVKIFLGGGIWWGHTSSHTLVMLEVSRRTFGWGR